MRKQKNNTETKFSPSHILTEPTPPKREKRNGATPTETSTETPTETPTGTSINYTPEREEIQEQTKINRRDFLRLMGAASVMTAAACRRPSEQIVPSLIRPPEVQPGIPSYYATSAPDGSGLLVKTREGRPIKLAGNSEHPFNQGGLSAYEVAGLMDLYDPDRLRRSIAVDRKTGKKTYRKEELILPIAKENLKQGDYVLLTGPINSPSSKAIIRDFLNVYPRGRHVEFRQDPTLRQIMSAQAISYGKELLPHYRLDKADLIVSVDADFLGTMPLSSYYIPRFSERRNVRRIPDKPKAPSSTMNRLICFESMLTLTGSNADERFAIRPGDQILITLALAAHIVIDMNQSPYANDSALRNFLTEYRPVYLSSSLRHESGLYKKGHFERVISKIGSELWNHRGKSLVLTGSPLAATGNNTAAQLAVNLLNSILGNDGKTIDYKNTLRISPGSSDLEMQSLIASMESGKVKSLILSQANLIYHLPPDLRPESALKKVKYILSLDDRMNETGRCSDAVLPISHYLESWGDIEMIEGITSLCQPVIRPLYQTRSLEDRLIQLAGGEIAGKKSFHKYLQSRWASARSKTSFLSFKSFWTSLLQKGYTQENTSQSSLPSRQISIRKTIQRLPKFQEKHWSFDNKKGELSLGLYYNLQVGDGGGANNAYRQEFPEPVTKIVWDNYVSILPETARRLKLKQGSLVEIKTQQNKIRLPVHLQPGLHPEAVLIPLGYGRSSAGKTADGVGENAVHLAGTGSDSFVFSGMRVHLKDTGETRRLSSTQPIYRHGMSSEEKAFFAPEGVLQLPYRASSQHGRPIAREISWEDFRQGKFHLKPEATEYPPKQELYPPWDYKEHRWNMMIDLNSCTGCGACVSSCNTENNIPMVGKKEVSVGREMHWLRIDRYWEGSEEQPRTSNQPMLCQHCENAPCENVCPVSATTHNSEGLNVMTYNRCIGTRYCANNCPYKVRRFNWFENWRSQRKVGGKLRRPQHLSLNPDVTVRSRGVMEKCTFCVQRINAARQEVRSKGETSIPDGMIRTACQEVCPSKAIHFGNILDEKSDVSKIAQTDKRSYQVLDFLGVKPQVTYLARIRNSVEDREGKTS